MTVARFGAYGGPALLFVAALVPPLRPAAAVAIVVGWLVLGLARHPGGIAWAASMPIAVLLTSPWLLGGDTPLGEVACAAPLSEIAVRRVVMALLVMGVVAGLAVVHRSGPAELGLRRPGRTEAGVALAGCAVLAAGGLVIGPWIARPFFGELSYPVPPAALVPAVLFGVANGVLEELGYRAALQAWLGRRAPAWAAIGFQGLVFGIVHAGPEVQSWLPVQVGLLAIVGIAAGIVRRRTGSLAIPIGIHVGADIALYVGLACRVAA